jgi:hypothetical protein
LSESTMPRDLQKLRRWLLAHRFEVENLERELSFGNQFTELRRGSVAIRIGYDRDQWFVAVGGPKEGSWFDTSVWEALLDNRHAEMTPSIREAAAFPIRRLPEIERALKQESTANRLEQLGWQRSRDALHLSTDVPKREEE